MTALDSGLTPKPLAQDRLPAFKPHHAAKHRLLREYMHVWLPKLGYSYNQVAIIDCFASAGRYRSREEGSPLVMLRAYLGWKHSGHFKSPPHFIFIESKKAFAQHLRYEIANLPDLRGATVDVMHGKYEDCFPRVIEHLATAYKQPVPSFSFIDPLGWKDNPFVLIQRYRSRLGNKAEALVYLPATFMARFAAQDGVKASLERAGHTLTEAEMRAPRPVLADRLAETYRRLLKTKFDWVTRFRIDPVRHNGYYLLFGTGHKDGLRAMKTAMWKIDPVGGEAYEQTALAAAGQDQIFGFSDVDALPETEGLPHLLEEHFGSTEFRIEEAEDYTLTQTRYLDRPHLRKWALNPLEDSQRIEIIDPSPGRRRKQFPTGTRIRFRPTRQ